MNPLWLLLACAHTPEAPVIDITTPPNVTAAPDFVPPVPTEHTLSNGIKVWLIERPGLPLVSLRLTVPGGSATDAPGAFGAASLADELLNHGAGDRDSTAFAQEVERLALNLGTATQGSASTVYMDAHTDQLDDGLALLADMILRPQFEADDIDRLKGLRVGALTEAGDDARTVASWVLDEAYYGKGHPFAHPTEGTIPTVESLTEDQLKASYKSRFIADHSILVASGDIKADTLLPLLEQHLAEWQTTGTDTVEIPAPPKHEGDGRHIFVNKTGTSQTALLVIMPAPEATSPASEPAELGSIVLGGTFTSRLNRLLREEKGYTYGARASYGGKSNYGYLFARTNVQRDVSAPALTDLISELKRYQNGIDEAELTKAVGSWQTDVVEGMASRRSIANTFSNYAVLGLPRTSLRDSLDRAQASTVDAVNAAVKHSPIENAIVVVVGDLAEIQGPIEAAVPADWTVLERN